MLESANMSEREPHQEQPMGTVDRKKPKLRRLGRSWDPVLTQGGSNIRLHKPGVQEWPYVREKISFGAIVE